MAPNAKNNLIYRWSFRYIS